MSLELEGGIKIYLREIAKTDLLTPAQEVELAEKIQRWDDEARQHMIRANLRFVVKIAQDYVHYGLPLLDLIAEGNIGLMKAVERFDPNKGGKLSTYSAWWIKQSIKRALANQSKTIRLPVHMVDKISKLSRVAMGMSEELGREPTNDELSDEIGIDRGKLSQLKIASMRPMSLDAPISADDSTEFGEIIRDEGAVDPAEALISKNMRGNIGELLTVLDERERKIIDARFGLAGQKPRTLEEVGQDFGVTRERIRQLQNIALKKLRRALQKKEKPLPQAVKMNGTRWKKGLQKRAATASSAQPPLQEKIEPAVERPTLPSEVCPAVPIVPEPTSVTKEIPVSKEEAPEGPDLFLPRHIKCRSEYIGLESIAQDILETVPDHRRLLTMLLSTDFQPGWLTRELKKITLPHIFFQGDEEEAMNWYDVLGMLLHFLYKHPEKNFREAILHQALTNLLEGKEFDDGIEPKDLFPQPAAPAPVTPPIPDVSEPVWVVIPETIPLPEKASRPSKRVSLKSTKVQAVEADSKGTSLPKDQAIPKKAEKTAGGSFTYAHPQDDCDLVRSFWGIPDETVHHTASFIWRQMAPASLWEVIQMLIQAQCITPKRAVQMLVHGDKTEWVKPRIKSYAAEMLGVDIAEVEKLLQ